MKAADKKIYERRISRVNEMRQKYWREHLTLRTDILSQCRINPDGPVKITDPDAKELLQTLGDMWESVPKEKMRRQSNTPRSKTIPLCPSCSAPLNDFVPKKKGGAGGLYTSNELCVVCGLPLSGRQKKYCSEACRVNAKSRNWRKKNPDEKAESNRKYLDTWYGKKRKSRKTSK